MHPDPTPTALVVGGSRGIGRAVALRLAGAGFDLCVTYRGRHEAAQAVQAEIVAQGRRCDLLCFDIADTAATEKALSERFPEMPPAVLVFNAGIARDNLMVWMTPDEWKSVTATNLDGFYNVVHPLLFGMLREKRGRIIAIASTSGQIGQAGQTNYSAAKAGLIGACKALAREVGRKGISVNVVSPGVIETEMTAELPREAILPLIPMHRFGTVEDVAAVVAFLAAEPHLYIHGQVIGVNGGLAL